MRLNPNPTPKPTHPSLVALCNPDPQPSPHPKAIISSFSSSIALLPGLQSWKEAPLSFSIIDLIEGNWPKFILVLGFQ